MKILYVHHAERDKKNKAVDRQLQDITENGIKETEILGEKLKQLNLNIKAIYSSPYLRCIHTAEIINKYINVPIYEETLFNEMNSSETWKEFSLRNMKAIDKIINNHDNEDFIICISSGVNLSPFVYYFNNIEPTNDSSKIQALTTSPVLFSTDGSCL
ncbi:MAG: histidine phosphatase family protein [Bacilli bacterium]|nr:histidine phosphatase family protein [Bacilli bacterium]